MQMKFFVKLVKSPLYFPDIRSGIIS